MQCVVMEKLRPTAEKIHPRSEQYIYNIPRPKLIGLCEEPKVEVSSLGDQDGRLSQVSISSSASSNNCNGNHVKSANQSNSDHSMLPHALRNGDVATSSSSPQGCQNDLKLFHMPFNNGVIKPSVNVDRQHSDACHNVVKFTKSRCSLTQDAGPNGVTFVSIITIEHHWSVRC